MDILEITRRSIETLPDGPHMEGLQSVLRHIEIAYKHFGRAQADNDETAFTDAIYRTNQAFEGSIKEAYRVLENKDPHKKSPWDIEQYFEKNKVFRERVLSQFTNYRENWRNPSTHDYSLDFDEDEAFLAIVSVSAFAKLLIDQISEKLSFAAIQKDINSIRTEIDVPKSISEPLVDRVVKLFLEFSSHYSHAGAITIETEAQLMGALSGFFTSISPDLKLNTGRIFRENERTYYTDMEITRGNEIVIVELKRGKHQALAAQGVNQLKHYVRAAKAAAGVLFLYADKASQYSIKKADTSDLDFPIIIIRPEASSQG
jgi:hypothetical protein